MHENNNYISDDDKIQLDIGRKRVKSKMSKMVVISVEPIVFWIKNVEVPVLSPINMSNKK